MTPGGRKSPIKKKVIYLDFRGELSAFDKFFYFGNVNKNRSKNKQEYLRNKSASLKNLFEEKKQFIGGKNPVNNVLEKISKTELEIISYILGRQYVSGKAIFHRLFKFEGYSVLFETTFAKYSEAFAGSGEMAVFRLVSEVLNAPPYSLILLDEPEVSLHPGAQERLKVFLLDQIIKKHHQIILTTHSPSIINGLPREGIKVFYQNPNTGRFFVKEDLLPEEAFYHIEFNIENKKSITVEDNLAKLIVDSVLDEMGEESKSIVDVKFNPGGETDIKGAFIPVYSTFRNPKEYILFDGDQRQEHINWRVLDSKSLENSTVILQKIKEQTGQDILFRVDSLDGKGNDKQRIDLAKKYLDYYLSNVFYLPKHIPEEIIWDNTFCSHLLQSYLNGKELREKLKEIRDANYKSKFSIISKTMIGDSNSNSIEAIQKQFIKKWLKEKDNCFDEIKDILNKIIES